MPYWKNLSFLTVPFMWNCCSDIGSLNPASSPKRSARHSAHFLCSIWSLDASKQEASCVPLLPVWSDQEAFITLIALRPSLYLAYFSLALSSSPTCVRWSRSLHHINKQHSDPFCILLILALLSCPIELFLRKFDLNFYSSGKMDLHRGFIVTQ